VALFPGGVGTSLEASGSASSAFPPANTEDAVAAAASAAQNAKATNESAVVELRAQLEITKKELR